MTICEVLYHMSLAPRLMSTDVRMIVAQDRLYRLIPKLIPKSLFDRLTAVLTRTFLAEEYDKAHAATLQALDAEAKEDFQKSLVYPDWDPLFSGEVTLERLFGYIQLHLEVHASEIREVLALEDAG